MPFKVTPYRLEMIADILFILGVIFSLILFFSFGGAGFPAGFLTLSASAIFSYLLYAAAKILRNTEDILDYLKNNSTEDNNDET
jgi:hypothetical protein